MMTDRDHASRTAAPLTRVIEVAEIPPHGAEVVVEASAEERAAVAKMFGLPALHELTGSFHLRGTAKRMTVKGRVNAKLTQICVVSLEPFDTEIEEEVDVAFAAPRPGAERPGAHDEPAEVVISGDQDAVDPPDEIQDGRIDLGALTAEFLALGLAPYPRRPGVEFSFREEGEEKATPFAALAKLRDDSSNCH
ncbi:DUF177 domain-containing protein [Chelatococcus sp. SYSU_G07232]|uniref:DUF177 domain-containing protein n=1 Tax=Chelatococcus albus TaxID=3047466 RepID=A0ABT7ACY8_9HYPH|nr:DUF177 domain-containing protein [Chelatococcus sp. SYSU_G07232]MDJ1156925.1 DUF177 domain-containing protein [Chelatococcus sp. SYSU_G07232]